MSLRNNKLLEYTSTCLLIEHIQNKGHLCIGIDGIDGAGKSTLARKLSAALISEHVNLDDFLIKNREGFLKNLKYTELKKKTTECSSFVIEGVCLLKALNEIKLKVDCLIYVKTMHLGYWSDERECDIDGDVEEFIKKEEEFVRIISAEDNKTVNLGLAEEIIRYHHEMKPHKRADVYYLRDV